MLEHTSSTGLSWKRFWFTIDYEIETYHHCSSRRRYAIRPGEVAHAEGVNMVDYYEFLLRKGYTLTADERDVMRHSFGKQFSKMAKPVLVLKGLGGGKFIVCRLSSWGGNFPIANLFSPMQRYFAFSMSPTIDAWPPDVKHLRLTPPAKMGIAAMAIPVERSVQLAKWAVRNYLTIGQLERLEGMIKRREQEFHKVAERLRETEVSIQKIKLTPFRTWPKYMRDTFSKSVPVDPFDRETSLPVATDGLHPNYKRQPFIRRRSEEFVKYRDANAPWLRIPKETNLLDWLYDRTYDDLVDCDIAMDPEPGHFRNVNPAMRYFVPRIVFEREKETDKPRSKSRRSFRKPRIRPSLRPGASHVRAFSTTVRLCKAANTIRFHFPIPFR